MVGVRAAPEAFAIADGIAVKKPGDLTGPILDDVLDEIVEVTSKEIAEAMVLILERTKLVVEGAGAVGIAALLEGKVGGSGPVAVVLSGGNIDASTLITVMRSGLTLAGRHLVVRTWVPDRPGELLRLLELVAKQRVNVLDVKHLREGVDIPVAATGIELTLLTRDDAHCEALIAQMRGLGLRSTESDLVPPGRRERKVVTVLFADLVGFTSRSEQLDPEDVAAELGSYSSHVREELERYGGTVEKFIGDAVMAIFGAPVAHEDDPERAVRAALAILEWAADEGVEMRIGVNTGEALVTVDARPEAGEGDGRRRRRQHGGAAPVGRGGERRARRRADLPSDRAGDRIRRRAGGRGEGQGRASARLAGGAGALRGSASTACTAPSSSGAHERLRCSRTRSPRTMDERSPQLVTLVGVPGIGKSRLVLELFQAVERHPDLIHWRHGRCLPYGEGVTFWALGEMVKAQAGILEGDSEADAERSCVRSPSDPWVESHLRPLVGLAGGAEARGDARDEAFTAWRRFFEELAAERPLVLVFEDLHWADDNLLDFVDHLVDWASGVPLLVVGTARPELLTRRPGWGGGKPNALTISLSPLSDDETSLLLHELLGSVLPAETQDAAARQRRRQPALRRGVRADAARPRRRRRDPGDRAGADRGAPRPARADAEVPAAGRRGDRQALLDRRGCVAGRQRGRRRSAARAPAQGVRPPRARELGRPARASTASATCSSATSPTARSRAPSGPPSISRRRAGSSSSAGAKTTRRCLRTTICRHSSSRPQRAATRPASPLARRLPWPTRASARCP